MWRDLKKMVSGLIQALMLPQGTRNSAPFPKTSQFMKFTDAVTKTAVGVFLWFSL
jgi:hypothetical protein